MDTRRDPGSRENRQPPALGTETVGVELVELQSVGSPGRGLGPAALLALVAAGVLAFAALVSIVKPQDPSPSPSAAAIADASPSTSPPEPTVQSTRLVATPAPPTPRPTAPPAWQWTSSDFLPDLNPSFEGIWAVHRQVLALVTRYDPAVDRTSWSIVKLMEPNDWNLFPAPPAIDQLSAGTVVDDRLWFFARVGGISESDTTWRLVSTADGETWESMGTAEGLPPLDWASVLTRTGDTWVIVTGRDEGMGVANDTISWSRDGRHWKPADPPDLRANVRYTDAASVGGATVMLGLDFDTQDDTSWFVLRSTDGRAWRRTVFESPSTSSAEDLACVGRNCVVTLQPYDTGSEGLLSYMRSTDGDDWSESGFNIPIDEQNATIGRLAPTGTGFIVMAGDPARALLSTDGRSWREVDVLPPGNRDFISNLAVAGDRIIAFSPRQSSDDSDRVWSGSLSAMGN